MRQAASLAPGSTFAMTYLVPIELADPKERPDRETAERGARASGTPFISHYTAEEAAAMARAAGLKAPRRVSADDLAQRYFAGRADGLRPSRSEELVVANT
jgi:O-methyltransferase involved in polyketide biosynthesis